MRCRWPYWISSSVLSWEEWIGPVPIVLASYPAASLHGQRDVFRVQFKARPLAAADSRKLWKVLIHVAHISARLLGVINPVATRADRRPRSATFGDNREIPVAIGASGDEYVDYDLSLVQDMMELERDKGSIRAYYPNICHYMSQLSHHTTSSPPTSSSPPESPANTVTLQHPVHQLLPSVVMIL
ncbi:hypothetical protein J6590_061853 [Homalodisca vitripennis]|nr:hypothetical protein J6590_061853 [Homalodisca vitripennis]